MTALALPVEPSWSAAVELAPHRAAYTMNLGTTRSGSSTVDARGVMYMEWAEACDGWTVSQRVNLRLYATQGGPIETESNFSSWESKDGLSYRFTVRNSRQGTVTEEFRGDARLDGPGRSGKATFSTPAGLTFDLPKGAVFPTEHTVQVIAAARNGQPRLLRVMFDGASADGPYEVNAVIGAAIRPKEGADELSHRLGWPIRMAFFPSLSQQAEPDYEVEVRLLENGVGQHFLLDYGDFTVDAVLDKLEPLPRPKC
jgi:hypothetical protein